MNKNRSFSGHKINVTPPSYQSNFLPYSTTGYKKKKSMKITPEVTDWYQLLNQISHVTQKVKKLCSSDKKQSIRSKTKKKRLVNQKYEDDDQLYRSQKQKLVLTAKTQKKISSNLAYTCNPNCHNLMHECIKLSHQNKKLNQQKQKLQKRLYYESKQKRQLRWKLQRERQKQMFKFGKQINNSFTLRLQKESNYGSNPTKYQLSESSYMTAKKTSPLKQRDNNIIKLKSVPFNSKQDDSLLIDFSVRIDDNKKQNEQSKSQKFIQSINLQKDLNELLQVCKHQTDRDKKKIIRKQMKQLAERIKKLKNFY